MSSKRIKRVIASRKQTDEEAANARRLRELAENDKPEIILQGRKLLAEKRRRKVE